MEMYIRFYNKILIIDSTKYITMFCGLIYFYRDKYSRSVSNLSAIQCSGYETVDLQTWIVVFKYTY